MKPNGVAAVLDVAYRRVVCVGAGPVAVRKLRKVMGKAQTVIVIAPKAESMIQDWHEAGQLIWYPRTFAANDVQQGDIVISAAGAQVGALVKTAAHAKGAAHAGFGETVRGHRCVCRGTCAVTAKGKGAVAETSRTASVLANVLAR